MPSTYKITTDQGVYNVTVDDGQAPAAAAPAAATAGMMPPSTAQGDPAPSPARMVSAGGRGTSLDVRKSADFAQGLGAAIPFAGIETPSSVQGYTGRVAGEAALMAVPVAKGVKAVGEMLPSAARAGAKFQQVMGAAGDLPVDVAKPGQIALRIQELAERGASMPMVVRKFLGRITDPEKGDLTYREARDFYHNISRLSANEFLRLTPVVKREVSGLRVALNSAIGETARVAGKLPEYQGAMKEYASAAKVKATMQAVGKGAKDAAVKYALPGGAAYYGVRKLGDLLKER